MVDRFERGLLMRSQPWVHDRFVRKGGFSYAVLLALPTSLLLWALIIISVGK